MTETTSNTTGGGLAFPIAPAYPIPSPLWYYESVWHLFQQSKIALDELLTEMATKADRDPELDLRLSSTLSRFEREMLALRTTRYPGAGFNPRG